jgi:glycosyltransferase involved in cell wall biosynthesis/SAM-dependent methyltransferase
MTSPARCWCGNSRLEDFSPEYFRCAECGTLVRARFPDPVALPDARAYHDSHLIQQFGFPPLAERARLDLHDRCLYWLRMLMRYKLPPGRVLDVGCGHGGFVALMHWVGFDAQGLEVDSSIADLASTTFGVPVLAGPLEQHAIPPASLDALVLFDVIEHVRDPASLLGQCLRLLKPDGVMALQTPQVPEDAASWLEGEPVLPMQDQYHLFLFSQRSIRVLFDRAGGSFLEFEPPFFPYDMFLFAGRQPLERTAQEHIAAALNCSPPSRLVRAMLDLRERFEDRAARHVQAEADATARLANCEKLENLLRESQADATARLANCGKLESVLRESQADAAARLANCEKLESLLRESEADRAARLQAEQNQAAQIAALERELEEQQGAIDSLVSKMSALHDEVHDLRLSAEAGLRTLSRLRDSHVFRLMRKFHLWSWVETGIEQTMRASPAGSTAGAGVRKPAKLERVLVDLTPVLPGGENGGAKILALNVIQELARIAPDCEFILLTKRRSHAELAALDSVNVRRICVDGAEEAGTAEAGRGKRRFERLLGGMLPGAVSGALEEAAAGRAMRSHGDVVRELEADLLFCPFTATYFFDPLVPAVSVVHDLQFLFYPQLFDSRTLAERDSGFRNACRTATKVIAVSEYVRSTILENSSLPPDRVATVYNSLPHRLPEPSRKTCGDVLARYGLTPERYLLYPANFWLHKNHEALLTALGIYLERNPASDLRLVCTGAPGARLEELRDAAGAMSLAERVIFAGYLPEGEFAALMRNCRAVIFPSLYEGFGMPLLEAMAAGKPVLTSNATCLPEVGADAVLLFDPRIPREIAEAIALIESEAGLRSRMIERGLYRVAQFGTAEQMAARYLQVFHEALGLRGAPGLGLHGVYPDGWTNDRMVLTFPRDTRQRYLQLELEGPEDAPSGIFSVAVGTGDGRADDKYSLQKGEAIAIRKALPAEGGIIQIRCGPVFQPDASIGGGDSRRLALKCRLCRVMSVSGETILFPTHAA